jgi:hypothetical protein
MSLADAPLLTARDFFCVSRGIFSHPYVGGGNAGRDPWSRMEAWLWLIAKARFKPSEIDIRGQRVSLARGQYVVTHAKLAQEWGWTVKQVRGFLDGLEHREMIVRKTGSPKGSHQTLLTISNYELYQLLEEHLGQPKGHPRGQPKGSPRATKEKGNTVKTENTHTEGDLFDGEVRQAFDAYNAVAKRRELSIARDLTPDRQKELRSRLDQFGGIPGWTQAMKRLDASAFLCGRINGSTFRADLNWLIDPKKTASFRKLVEGGYSNGLHADGARADADGRPEWVRAAEEADAARKAQAS